MDVDVARERLAAALKCRPCVTVWLGYGDVLFIGFGDHVLPGREGTRRAHPPFELYTHFAEWWIERAGMRAAQPLGLEARDLIGRRCTCWRWDGPRGDLEIEFEGPRTLRVRPGEDTPVGDAWTLSAPDGKALAVSTDGRAVVVDGKTPIREHWRPVE